MEFRGGTDALKFDSSSEFLWFVGYRGTQEFLNTINQDALEDFFGAAEGEDVFAAVEGAFLKHVGTILELAENALADNNLNTRGGAEITTEWIQAKGLRKTANRSDSVGK